MPTEMLTGDEHRVLEEPPRAARPTRPDELRMAGRRYAARVRRLKLSVAVWGVWTILITTLWDGSPVSTPVWFVEEDGRLFVMTAADSYEAKRLQRNPAAMVAPCTARGVPKGDAIPVQVEFLPPEEHARVERMMAQKYRVDRVLILPIYRLVMKLRGKPIDERSGAYLAITST